MKRNPRAVVRCKCGKSLRVKPELVNRRVQCYYCKAEFFVPKVSTDPLAQVKSSSSAIVPPKERPPTEGGG